MFIQILCTGGTIDKCYPTGAASRDLSFDRPAAISLLGRLKTPLSLRFRALCAKDSLDLSETDRLLILRACKATRARQIVITHGTDTMTQTATRIAAANLNKTIVLTGALQPACMRETDADFNLGSALAGVQLLPQGVYIAMNGYIFPYNECQKNQQTGIFEKL
jgi:L-asparaginase